MSGVETLTGGLTGGLNPEQRRAVETLDGPLLILAGAGSGKTRVLTRRIAHLLEQRRDVAPWNVMAVTFTNKAAQEMRERVAALVGSKARDLFIGTFHSLCLRVLRQDIAPLGFTRDFVIWDDEDQVRAIKEILKEKKLDSNKDISPKALAQEIDRAKNELKGPKDLRPGTVPAMIFAAYEAKLRRANALDFNDIINRVVELWGNHPDVLNKWRRKLRYIMVDEYQDTNPAQFAWLKLLVGSAEDGPQNLAVVGDDDQSIYSFRGADIRNILDFEKHYPSAAVIKLEQNYRSTGWILKAASGVVQRNQDRKDKTLWTEAEVGHPLRLWVAGDSEEESLRVMGEIERLRAQASPRILPSDIAIIFRTNAQSRPFEQQFVRRGIPYVLVGGRKFYERKEVRDLLAYLKLVLNPADDLALLRIANVPSRGLGDKALDGLRAEAAAAGVTLREAARRAGWKGGRAGNAFSALTALLDRLKWAADTKTPAELIGFIAQESGYLKELEQENTAESKERIENIKELMRAAGEQEPDPSDPLEVLRQFVDQASLTGQADELPSEGGKVTLLTVHLAKGLEYPVVFVVGLAQKLFPHARSETEREIEEERRLFYVALTRARERLYLSYPVMRRMPDGGVIPGEASQFLRELPLEAIAAQDRHRLSQEDDGEARPAQHPAWRSRPPADRPWIPGSSGFRPPAPPPRPPGAWSPARPPVQAAPRPPVQTAPRPPVQAAPRPPEPPPDPARPALFPSFAPARPPAPPPAAAGGAQPTRPAAALPPSAIDHDDGEEYRTMVPESLESLKIGLTVYHPTYGIGTISKREGVSSNPLLTIHFQKHGPRAVVARFAGLEIVL